MSSFISEIMTSAAKDKLFDQIVVKNYNKIYKYCSFRLRHDKFMAEECTQDVFTVLFKSMDKLNNFDKIDGWLYKTAENFIRRMLLRSARDVNKLTYFDSNDNHEYIENLVHEDQYDFLEQDDIDMEMYLKRIFENLTEMDIMIWDLYFKQNKSQSEVASLLRLSVSAVKSRTSRLKSKIMVLTHSLFEEKR